MNIVKLKQGLFLLAVILMVNTMNGYSQKTREEISDKYKWNLTDLFPNDDAWRTALNEIKGRLNEVESFKRNSKIKISDHLLYRGCQCSNCSQKTSESRL